MLRALCYILKKMIVSHNKEISNSIGIKSIARYLVEISEKTDFDELSTFLDEISLPFLIIGEGTNIVPPDYFDGIVITSTHSDIKVDTASNILSSGAAVNWHSLVKFSLKNNITGFENLSLIPGSVGAAPIQNIGAYGVEVSTLIDSIDCYDLSSNNLVSLSNKDCNFSYRNSILKNSSLLVITVNFKFSKSTKINCKYKSLQNHISKNLIDVNSLNAARISEIVCDIRSEVLPDHNQIFNVGSFFKNPIINVKDIDTSFFSIDDLIIWDYKDGLVKVGAARLIELIKSKIKPSANVSLYENHCLVLVTNGKSSQKEILAFANQIQSLVKVHFNVWLEVEPTIIN